MRKISLLFVNLMFCLSVITLITSCSKEDVDTSEENIEEVNPEIEESETYLRISLNGTTSTYSEVSSECLWGYVSERFGPNGEKDYGFLVASGTDLQVIWNNSDLDPHIYKSVEDEQLGEDGALSLITIDPCSKEFGPAFTMSNFTVEITSVGQVGEAIVGTFKGLLAIENVNSGLEPFEGDFRVIRYQ